MVALPRPVLDPKDWFELAIESRTAAAGTPAGRNKRERFGESSVARARWPGPAWRPGEQSAQEPLFACAASIFKIAALVERGRSGRGGG